MNLIKEFATMKLADYLVVVAQKKSRKFWEEPNGFVAITALPIEEQLQWQTKVKVRNYSNSYQLIFPLIVYRPSHHCPVKYRYSKALLEMQIQ